MYRLSRDSAKVGRLRAFFVLFEEFGEIADVSSNVGLGGR
jgi:hypothetical protein